MFDLDLSQFPIEELLVTGVGRAVRVLIVLIAALIVARVSKRFVRILGVRVASVLGRRAAPGQEIDQRTATLTNFVGKAASIAIWTIAAMVALREVGFDVAPLLAGAGVVGLAVGFGAQNLVRDIITGLFMLLEDQVSVGDVAVVNGTGGLVEDINLRTIVLRDLQGAVHIFPNGSITTLTNLTKDFSCYVFDIGVAYKEDADQVMGILREVSDELLKDEEFAPLIKDPLEIFGVDRFADSAVVIKARIKTAPGKQWAVGRETNRRIKKTFDERGIEIPFPQRTLHLPSDKDGGFGLDEAGVERIRAVVREELAAARAS